MQNQVLKRMGKLALLSALLISSLTLWLDAPAKPKDNGDKHGAAHVQRWEDRQKGDPSFNGYWNNERDRDRFRDWLDKAYGRSYPSYNVSAGVLARNGITRAEFEALPPGIRKNVLRGKSIPPGLQPGHRLSRTDLNRISPISDAILDALGLPRDRYRYNDSRRVGRLDDDAILYNPVTGLIFDVLRGVF
jgi:hypothetical protein